MLLLALFAATAPAEIRMPSWLAGYWLECSADGEASEMWSDARNGLMLGASKSLSGQRFNWEFSRIDRSGGSISFFAYPSSQPPAEFPAIQTTPEKTVFENQDHDFPQRVIYLRDGDRLTARIEGTVEGRQISAEWRYSLKPLNTTCPH